MYTAALDIHDYIEAVILILMDHGPSCLCGDQ